MLLMLNLLNYSSLVIVQINRLFTNPNKEPDNLKPICAETVDLLIIFLHSIQLTSVIAINNLNISLPIVLNNYQKELVVASAISLTIFIEPVLKVSVMHIIVMDILVLTAL